MRRTKNIVYVTASDLFYGVYEIRGTGVMT